MTPADKALRLQETWAEQSENLRMLLAIRDQLLQMQFDRVAACGGQYDGILYGDSSAFFRQL